MQEVAVDNKLFTKTWTEELVAEWLQLNGYLVEVGLPVGVTPAGGRYAADVIGAKISQLSGGRKT